ncbi:MAG: hypothetical protein JNL79_36000 [Myxococcales bacterium]|nr:hypothetical protein [Myxococcales bacterium]
MLRRLAPCLLTPSLLVGCRTEPPKVDPAPDTAQQIVSAVAAIPELRAHLSASSLERTAAGFHNVQAGLGGFRPAGEVALRVTVPTTAEAPTRLAHAGDPDFWIELSPVGVGPRAAAVTQGAVVFARAAAHVDVVHVLEPHRYEELRRVHDPAAGPSRWLVQRGPSVATVKVEAGVVQLLSADGHVRLETEAPFAVDARGTRVSLTPTLEGDALTLALPSGLAFPVTVDPAWKTVAPMAAKRRAPHVATLADGRVLVAGGTDGTFTFSTAEIFDPTTSLWTNTGSMKVARWYGSATRLKSGLVLVAGGYGGEAKSETFDPATGTWTAAGDLPTPRAQQRAVLHPTSGVVYLAGNEGGTDHMLAFDPTTRTWSKTSPTSFIHDHPGAIVLPSAGKVLVAAGSGSAAELWDVATDKWTTTGSMTATHRKPAMIPLPSGNVLCAGGDNAIVEAFDVATKTWSVAGTLVAPRFTGFGAVPTADGRWLLTGGYDGISAAELLTPGTPSSSTAVTPMGALRFDHAAAPLGASGSSVLVAGGYSLGGPTSSAEVFQTMPNGQACSLAIDCASGLCVDGVCCSSACNGKACQACDVAGSIGTCVDVPSGAPHAARSCGAYGLCSAGACATTCALPADCSKGYTCTAGACVARKPNGATCAKDDDCTSNACTDGVCCNVACKGQCETCSAAGSVGTCKAVTGVPVGRPACTGIGVGTGPCGQACDGVDGTKCHYPKPTTPCSGNACTTGVETHASFCDGGGKCLDVPKSCGAYTCDAASCKSKCTTKDDCAAGFYCAASACVPAADLGRECKSSTECSTGACSDGVCCGVAACDAGSSCANPGKKGVCSRSVGTSCKSAAECGSGYCIDGVCCGAACDGQCEACDVVGKVGVCFPVKGAPRGDRARCADGAGDVCKAMSCDGAVDTTKCTAFAAATTECAPASCTTGTATAASYCDGIGACRAAEPRACAPYACGEKGCRTSCATDTECAAGNVCRSGACVPNAAKCSTDGLVSIVDGVEHPCTPYRCRGDGTCGTLCSTSAECAPGSACDPSSKCVPIGGDAGADGGCSHGARGPSALAGIALALALAGRRRRR